MQRSQILDTMGQLKLYGMKAAYDEILTTAVKRQHEPQRVIGDLLQAEISEKRARSIKYQMTVAKLPALIIHTSTVRPNSGARQHSAPIVTTPTQGVWKRGCSRANTAGTKPDSARA